MFMEPDTSGGRSEIDGGSHSPHGRVLDRPLARRLRHATTGLPDVLEVRLHSPARLEVRRVADLG